tara:strand:+ start:82 stop:1008 length:927 start_codon:yes stop_codon:yes gene_type:complete
MEPISGLISAPYTPFKPDGGVHLERIDDLVEHTAATGLAGVFPCGTTGEFPSLTLSERRQVSERWTQGVAGRFRVIVHVGGTCLGDSKELAAHAAGIHADGIAMMAPYFFRPATVEELVDYCEQVAAAAPDVPFYYYHIPVMSGVTLPMRDFLELASGRIPSLAGIKFTHPDPMDIRRCLAFEDGRYDVLFGMDEALLAALALGCRAAVGTTYGFAAPLSQGIIAAFDRGDMDEANRLQLLSAEMVAVYRKYNGAHPAMKTMMKICGLDCGPVRAPLRPLSEAEEDTFRREIEATGGLQFCPGSEMAG